MTRYPYPLRDWRKPSEYPKPNDRDATGWAWEFLRRNPEYQRLWDLFDSLPDSIEWDNRGFSDTKHGKWRGTRWAEFRFLTGGACWYANPEPIPGEDVTEYEARCPEGEIMPFADYLMGRFRLQPWPIAPAEELSEHHGFGEYFPEDSEGPWPLNVGKPTPEYAELYPELAADQIAFRDQNLDELAADPTRVTIVFDLCQPLEQQLDIARDMLREEAEAWSHAREARPHFRPREHARHIRLLDAAAAGATLEEMAATLHPREANGYAEGYRVTKRLRRDLKQAERLRDSQYWRLPPWNIRWE